MVLRNLAPCDILSDRPINSITDGKFPQAGKILASAIQASQLKAGTFLKISIKNVLDVCKDYVTNDGQTKFTFFHQL